MKRIEDVILFQIDLTGKVSKQHSQKVFNELKLGITVEQWIILKIVSENSDISQKELAEKSFRDTASITRTLDLLEKKNLLRRESIPNNRRMYNIQLTKVGQKFIEQNMEMVQTQRKKSVEGISEKDLEKLAEILTKIRKNFE